MEPEDVQKFLDSVDSLADAIRDPDQTPFAVDPSLTYWRRDQRPRYYHRDGKPILSNELSPDFMQWAMLFETANRTVKQNRTLYGERLSTVWLGMDHSFFDGPPLLFETMLFAPDMKDERRRLFASLRGELSEDDEADLERDRAEVAKRYPHDQLQRRYTHEDEARESHLVLYLQCLIPPRWRRFLLYTIGRDETWN